MTRISQQQDHQAHHLCPHGVVGILHIGIEDLHGPASEHSQRAGELWQKHWPDEPADVYAAMRAVTSIMRAQQILIAELDGLLRRHGITFSRYEALVLLTFSQHGSLPLSKIGTVSVVMKRQLFCGTKNCDG